MNKDKKPEIKLVPFRVEWEKIFLREKKILDKEIGEHVLDIRHVGSTSIQEMSANPAIDILITIESLSIMETLEGKLKDMRYRRHQPWTEFVNPLFVNEGAQAYHLHFVEQGQEGPYLLFKKALESDGRLAKEYKEMKIRAMKKYQHDPKKYFLEKGNWIGGVLRSL